MKRLTFRTDSGSVIIHPDFKDDPDIGQKLANRLAAYEDTGMEPEEIERIADAYGRGMTLRQENGERLQLIRDMATADQDDRLVVLPCKVGDTVYRIWTTSGRDPEITEHILQDKAQIIRWLPSFGRIVFLTYEEAQAALVKAAEKDTQEINQKRDDLTKEDSYGR